MKELEYLEVRLVAGGEVGATGMGGNSGYGGGGGKGGGVNGGASASGGGQANNGGFTFGFSVSVCPGGKATSSTSNTENATESSAGCSGGISVICTQLARTGDIEHATWAASQRYTTQKFSQQVMNGYHLWGVPYVKLMRQSPMFAAIVKHPVTWFAEDSAYRMGARAKPNYMGWALRELAFRPVCWSIGVFAKARDFQHLWTGKIAMA